MNEGRIDSKRVKTRTEHICYKCKEFIQKNSPDIYYENIHPRPGNTYITYPLSRWTCKQCELKSEGGSDEV